MGQPITLAIVGLHGLRFMNPSPEFQEEVIRSSKEYSEICINDGYKTSVIKALLPVLYKLLLCTYCPSRKDKGFEETAPASDPGEGDGAYEDVNLVEGLNQEPAETQALQTVKPEAIRQAPVPPASESSKAPLTVEPPAATFPTTGGKLTHTLKNPRPKRMVFKIKCSNNYDYGINPVYGFVEANGNAVITVTRLAGAPKDDKMVIQFVEAPAEGTTAEQAFGLASPWALVSATVPLRVVAGAPPLPPLPLPPVAGKAPAPVPPKPPVPAPAMPPVAPKPPVPVVAPPVPIAVAKPAPSIPSPAKPPIPAAPAPGAIPKPPVPAPGAPSQPGPTKVPAPGAPVPVAAKVPIPGAPAAAPGPPPQMPSPLAKPVLPPAPLPTQLPPKPPVAPTTVPAPMAAKPPVPGLPRPPLPASIRPLPTVGQPIPPKPAPLITPSFKPGPPPGIPIAPMPGAPVPVAAAGQSPMPGVSGPLPAMSVYIAKPLKK
ncbi:hypothetical protein Y032_0032g2532 [Ancylostoma ceylanicum]|uniref:Major sperm protein n=1 Tax=Ancylostoma ceylanicum TaxID=53326 RepID=A0A016UPJ3_9BILA|nr:hypothetical protein Y032_0032g2532 [Ancylostoma ceylanicum]